MAKATLTISSKNYSSWSLRGWLLTKFSGLEFDEIVSAADEASARAEILLLSSSILVPCSAGALPLDLRRNSFGLYDVAVVAAGEHQGTFPRIQNLVARAGRHRSGVYDLERLSGKIRRTVSVRPPLDGGRDVRAGRHALHDLRCADQFNAGGLREEGHGASRDGGVGCRRAA